MDKLDEQVPMDIESICKFLNNALEKKGCTIYWIEKISGLQRNQIKTILGGSGSYTVDSLLKILDALDAFVEIKPKP